MYKKKTDFQHVFSVFLVVQRDRTEKKHQDRDTKFLTYLLTYFLQHDVG